MLPRMFQALDMHPFFLNYLREGEFLQTLRSLNPQPWNPGPMPLFFKAAMLMGCAQNVEQLPGFGGGSAASALSSGEIVRFARAR